MVLKKRQRALSEFGNMGVEQPETPVSNIGSPRKVSKQCKEPMQDPAGAKHRQVSLRDGAAIRINEAQP